MLGEAVAMFVEEQGRVEIWLATNMFLLNQVKTGRLVFSLREMCSINHVQQVGFLGSQLAPGKVWGARIESLIAKLHSCSIVQL